MEVKFCRTFVGFALYYRKTDEEIREELGVCNLSDNTVNQNGQESDGWQEIMYARYVLWRSDVPAWNDRRRRRRKKKKRKRVMMMMVMMTTMMIVNHI